MRRLSTHVAGAGGNVLAGLRDAQQAAAGIEYILVDGAFQVPGDAEGYLRSTTPIRLIGEGVGARLEFLPLNGAPLGSQFGLVVDSPADVTVVDAELVGSGEQMTQVIRHGYMGGDRVHVRLERTKVRGAAYAVKSQGRRTSVETDGCDLEAWITPILHTHDVGDVDAKDRFRRSTLRVKKESWHHAEHGAYIYPQIDAEFDTVTFQGVASHAIQSNGTEAPGKGRLVVRDCVVEESCVGGIHGNPNVMTEVIGGIFTPKAIPFRLRAGGMTVKGATIAPTGVREPGQDPTIFPEAMFIDNESGDYGGLLVEDCTLTGNPSVAFLWRQRPSRHDWVLRRTSVTQTYDGVLSPPYPSCFIVSHSASTSDPSFPAPHTVVDDCDLWVKYGRLWNLEHGEVDVRGGSRLLRGPNTQASHVASSAYANVR